MKKLLLIFIATASIAANSNAQKSNTDVREKFQFGFKAGANLSNVYDSKGEQFDADPKLGFATGAYFAIPIGRYFGVQPEVLFSQKGFHATGRFFGSSYEFTRTTSYIDIPLFFAFKPLEFITVLAGPQYSYLIKQTDEFKTTASSSLQEKEFKNDNIRKNTLCFVGGADITIKHFVLGARLGWDIQNNNGDGTSATPRYKNVWYQATLGYRFYF
jgi:hypothetical protein